MCVTNRRGSEKKPFGCILSFFFTVENLIDKLIEHEGTKVPTP